MIADFLNTSGWLDNVGYTLIFLTTLFEATPIGFFVPGFLIVIVAGFLARLGSLSIFYVFCIAFLGALTGDLLGYLIGKKIGSRFLIRYGKYFFMDIDRYNKAKKVMDAHAGKAIAIGRFNPLTRSFAPFILGSTDIKFSRFIFYAIISSLSWVFISVGIGYIFGHGFMAAQEYFVESIILLFLVAAFIAYGFYVLKKYKTDKNTDRIKLFLMISSFTFLLLIIYSIMYGELARTIDISVNQEISALGTQNMMGIMAYITMIGNPLFFSILCAAFLAFLVYRKKLYYSLVFFLSIAFGFLSETLLKFILHQIRPENHTIEVAGYSLPSGHATMSIIFFCLMYYSFKDAIKNCVSKITFLVSCITLFILIGFSRVYLRVHWLSDVIAGFFLGVFCMVFSMVIVKYILKKLWKYQEQSI